MNVYIYDWVSMSYSRNWHNSVNQLHSNKKEKEKEKKKKVEKRKCVKEVRAAGCLSILCQEGVGDFAGTPCGNKTGLEGAEERKRGERKRAPSTMLLVVHFMEVP